MFVVVVIHVLRLIAKYTHEHKAQYLNAIVCFVRGFIDKNQIKKLQILQIFI